MKTVSDDSLYTKTKIELFIYFQCIAGRMKRLGKLMLHTCYCRQTAFSLVLLIILSVQSSCKPKNTEADIILTKAHRLIDQHPDSALSLLDTIHQPMELSKEKYAEYVLLTVQARNEADRDSALSLSDASLKLSAKEEKNKHYELALKHYKQYANSAIKVLKDEEKQALIEIQEKYDNELLENENNSLEIERLWIYSTVSPLLFLSCFLYYRKRTQYKNKLLEAEQQISSLKSMAESYNEKENTLRNGVLRHINILKRIALLNEQGLILDDKRDVPVTLQKINKIIYGRRGGFDWDTLFISINALNDGIIDCLRKTFPQLDNTELKICYLTYARFSNSEISTLLKLELNTVSHKKSIIRGKIGVIEYGDIAGFMDQVLKKD